MHVVRCRGQKCGRQILLANSSDMTVVQRAMTKKMYEIPTWDNELSFSYKTNDEVGSDSPDMNLVIGRLPLLSLTERTQWEIWPPPDRRISRPRSPSTWRTERRTSWRRRWRGGRGWWWRWYSPGRHRGDWLARPLAERGRNRAGVSSAELRSSGVTPAWCLLPPRTQSSRAWRDSPRRICRPPGTKCRRWWSACPLHRILMEALLVLNHYILTVASLVCMYVVRLELQSVSSVQTLQSDDIIWIFLTK